MSTGEVLTPVVPGQKVPEGATLLATDVGLAYLPTGSVWSRTIEGHQDRCAGAFIPGATLPASTIVEMQRKSQRLRASSPEDIRAAGWRIREVMEQYDPDFKECPGDGGWVHVWAFFDPKPNAANQIRIVRQYGSSDAEALNKIREQIGIPMIPVE